jgi:hypothetical protein
MRAPTHSTLACALIVSLALGCKRGSDAAADGGAQPSASQAPPAPLDRLAPGELSPGKHQVFGFVVPKAMKIVSRSPSRVLLEGEVEAGELIDYVRVRVLVSHVEVGAGRTIFPLARIKDGPPDHQYQIEVIPNRRMTTMTVEDVTPLPKIDEKLSEEERWRRAGRRSDGSVDPMLLK